MAENKKISLLIDKLMTATGSITDNGYYDLILLPEAESIITRGQVISIFGSSDMAWGDDKIESYSISVGNGSGTRKISIGGNYYKLDDLKFDGGDWSSFFGFGDADISELDIMFSPSFAYQFDYGMMTDRINGLGQVVLSGGTSVAPSQYNLYHVSVNDNYVGGAIYFDCAEGELVLTAQNGASLANIYNTVSTDKVTYLKRDEDIAFRSDSYGLYTHYRDFYDSGSTASAPVSGVSTWNVYDYEPFDYDGLKSSDKKYTPKAPYTKVVSYTINAKNKLVVSSDLVGKIQSNAAAFISRYSTGYVDSNKNERWDYGEEVWNYNVNNYTVVAAGVHAEELELQSNFRTTIAATNNSALFRAKFGYSDASGGLSYDMISVNGYNEYWDVYDATVAWDEIKIDDKNSIQWPPTPTVGTGAVVVEEKVGDKTVQRVYSLSGSGAVVASGTSIGGGQTATGNTVETIGIDVDGSLKTAENSVWAGTITVNTSNVKIFADLYNVGYIKVDEWEKMCATGVTVSDNKIGAYGLRADDTIYISQMGSLLNDKEKVGDTKDVWSNATINVTVNNNQIWAYNGAYSEIDAIVKNSSITAAAIWSNKLILDEVTDKVNFNVTARNNAIWGQDENSGCKIEVYGLHASTIEFGFFDGNITIDASDATTRVVGIEGSTVKASGNLNGKIDIDYVYSVGIAANNLTVNGVLDTEIDAGAGVYVSGTLTMQAFTGNITAETYGITVEYNSDNTMNIAGVIQANNADMGYYAISSIDNIDYRISGKVWDMAYLNGMSDHGYAIVTEYRYREDGGGFVRYDKVSDTVRVTSTGDVQGMIDLGGGVNNIFLSSGATVVGGIAAEAGAVNIMFELEKANAQTTLTMGNGGAVHEDDKTLKDSSTITLNLNYATSGQNYRLIDYNYNDKATVDECWANAKRPRVISLHYQGQAFNVVLDNIQTNSYGNRTAEGTVNVAGVNVTVKYENYGLTVSLDKDMPRAVAVESTATIDHFVDDIVEVEKGKILLDWSNFDKYLRERLDAGTLADEGNYAFEEITSYQIVYVLRDKNGKQLGYQVTKAVDGSKSSLEFSVETLAATLPGVSPSDIASAKIVSITVVGKDVNDKQIDSKFNFSEIDKTYEKEFHSMEFSWDDLHQSFNEMIALDLLKASGRGFSSNGDNAYEVTLQIRSKQNKLIGTYVVEVDGTESSVQVNMLDLVEATNGAAVSWSDIGNVTISKIALVDQVNNIRTERLCEITGTPVLSTCAPNNTITLEWNDLAAAWEDSVKNGSMTVSGGVVIKNIDYYEIEVEVLDVDGNVIANGIKIVVNSLNQNGTVVSSYADDMSAFLAKYITDSKLAASAATVRLNNVTVYGKDNAGTLSQVETKSVADKEQDIRCKEISLNWSDTVADWNALLNNHGLKDDTNKTFAAITGYVLVLEVIDNKGNRLTLNDYKTADLDGVLTLNLKDLKAYGMSFDIDSVATVNLVSVKVEGETAAGVAVNFDYAFTDTKDKTDVNRMAQGMTFNWSVMYEEIATKAMNGVLRDNNGVLLNPPDDPTVGYKYIYNITFSIYDTDGNYLGDYRPAGGYDSYIGRLDFDVVAAEGGWTNVGDAQIKDIAVDVIYGKDSNGHDKIFTVHYDFPEVGTSMFCNTIKVEWSEAELLAANPAITYSITGYKITFAVKDKAGKVIDSITRDFAGNTASYGVDLTEVARELGVARESIGSVALQEVTALGADLNLNTNLKPAATFQPGSEPSLVLDWSAFDKEVASGKFLDRIDTPKHYTIYYDIIDRSTGKVLAKDKLPPAGETLYVGSSGSYTFDLDMLAKKYGIAAENIEVQVTKFTVHGTANGQTAQQEMLGFDIVNAAAPKSPVSVMGCENLQNYMANKGYGAFTTVTYTYRLLDNAGNVLGLIENNGAASASDQLSITINGNGGAGYLYLKDNEYLLEGNATLENVAAVEIVKVEVSDGVNPAESYNSVSYDEITRDSELDWTGKANSLAAELTAGTLTDDDGTTLFKEITGYVVSYMVFDAKGNILDTVVNKSIESKDITQIKVNLTQYNKDNDDVFAEITGLTAVGKDDSENTVSKSIISSDVELPEISATLDWSYKTWDSAVVAYNVYCAVVDKNGNVLYKDINAHQATGTSLTVNLKDYASNDKFDLNKFAEIKLVKVEGLDAAGDIVDTLTNEGSAMLQIDLTDMFNEWNSTNTIGGEAITANSIQSISVTFNVVDSSNRVLKKISVPVAAADHVYSIKDIAKFAENEGITGEIYGLELVSVSVTAKDGNGADRVFNGYKTEGVTSFAPTGEDGKKKATISWKSFSDAADTLLTNKQLVDEYGTKFAEITSYTINYVVRDKDGVVIGKVQTLTQAYDVAKDDTKKFELTGLGDNAVSVDILEVIVVGKDAAGKEIDLRQYDRVENKNFVFDISAWKEEAAALNAPAYSVFVDLIDSNGKVVSTTPVEIKLSAWKDVVYTDQIYAENSAVTASIKAICGKTSKGDVVLYERSGAVITLDNTRWMAELAEALADPSSAYNGAVFTSYTVSYVLRNSKGEAVATLKELKVDTDGSAPVAIDLDTLVQNGFITEGEKNHVVSGEITVVTANGTLNGVQVNDVNVFDVFADTLSMEITWDTLVPPANGNLDHYELTYVLRDTAGNVLGNYITVNNLTSAAFKVDLQQAADDLTAALGRKVTVYDISAAEIVAITWHDTDPALTTSYAGFENVKPSTSPTTDGFTLNWGNWAGSYIGIYQQNIANFSYAHYKVTYDVLDDEGMVIATQEMIVKKDYTSYNVDEVQLADKLNISTDDIVGVKLTNIVLLDSALQEIAGTSYSGFQKENQVSYDSVGYMFNWEKQHEQYMAKILAETLKGKDSSGKSLTYETFEYYDITYVVKDNAGNIMTGTQGLIRVTDTTADGKYFVDIEKIAADHGIDIKDIGSVEIESIQLVGKYGEDVTVTTEFVSATSAVFDWSAQHSAWLAAGAVTGQYSYSISFTLYDSNDKAYNITADNLTQTFYTLDIMELAADGHNFEAPIVKAVLNNVTLAGTANTWQANEVFILNAGTNSTKLDWTALDAEMQAKIANKQLLDDSGNPVTAIDSYKIWYVLLDNNGDPISIHNRTIGGGGKYDTSYIVDLSVDPNAVSAKLTNVMLIDDKGDEYSFSWSESVSVVSRFVENYDEDARTLSVSWYGLTAEEFGWEDITAFEIEYIIKDRNGVPLGDSIGVRTTGKNFVIQGVEHGFSVEWRVRALGDDFALRTSDWSDWRIVDKEISNSIASSFELPEDYKIECVVADAINQTEGKVVSAVANISWEAIESKRPIRNYVIEYCELAEPLDLSASAPAGMSFAEYIASNDPSKPGLFTDGYYNGDPSLRITVYTKTVTGTEVVISQNSASYVYWRICAVDDSGNKIEGTSEWLAGSTYRVWPTPDDDAPVFNNESTGLLDVDFPGLAVQAPVIDAEASSKADKIVFDPATAYEAVIGWNEAFDNASGIYSYTIMIKDENGNYVKWDEVSFEDKVPYSCGSWKSSELDIDGIYRVIICDDTGAGIPVVDAFGNTVSELTDITVRSEDGSIVELSWFTQSDFSGAMVKIQMWNAATGTWGNIFDDQDQLVDDYKYTHYDYNCRLTGLGNREYEYKIIAKDFSGNESEAISGSFVADQSKPVFTVEDKTMVSELTFIFGGANDPVMFDGSIYWSAASDSESKVRSYQIKFDSTGNSGVDSKEFTFNCDKLDSKVTVIDFKQCTDRLPFTIIAGNYYTVTINGQQSEAIKADKDNELRLDFYVANLNGASVEITYGGINYQISNVNSLQTRTFEWKTTRVMVSGLISGNEYMVVFGSESMWVTATLDKATNNAVLLIDRDLMYKNVQVLDQSGNVMFSDMLTPLNSALFYRVDMSDFPERLPASGYNYVITAVDYFGQAGQLHEGEIVADYTAPVFPAGAAQTGVSGLLFTVPQGLPGAGAQEITTKYSAWIGWMPADDGEDGSGIRAYDITFTAGGSTETVTILKDELYGYSTASWKGSNLQEGSYRVRINGKNVAAWLSSDGSSVEWKVDTNLEGAQVTILYEGNILAENVSGTTGNPAAGEYFYNFVPGKTFAEWTLKGTGNNGGLDSSKVYEVFINGTLCTDAALRNIDGKLRLTWTIDGNFVEADTSTPIIIKEDGVVIYDSSNNAHRNSDTFEKSFTYYECVWQVTDITDKNLQYTISATDYCNNSTNERECLEGSILVDSGAPKFPGSFTATWGSPEEDANGDIKISPAFSWQPAVDSDGDLGVRYYELYIGTVDANGKTVWTLERTFSQEEVVKWNESDQSKPLYQTDKSFDWAEYKYKIVAYDYFGNSAAVEDTFGTPDFTPPVGAFTHEFTSSVSASWTKTKLRVFVLDEEGALIEDENDKTGYKTKLIDARGALKSASVTLTWGDDKEPDFVDENKIYYRVTVSNYIGEQENLTKPDYESYDFWTTSTSMTFDNKTPGCPVGIFENWDNVYWCVTVYDEFYNGGDSSTNSSLKSDWYEFKFEAVDTNTYNAGAENELVLLTNQNDKEGKLFSYEYSETSNETVVVRNYTDVIDELLYNTTKLGMTSAPNSITANYAWEDGRGPETEIAKHAGTAAITWKQDNEVLGVYEYVITLSNEFFTYTATTTDADRKGAATDMAKEVTYNSSTKTFRIDDLSKFLGLYNIPDGDYKLTITAVDTNGRKIKSSAFDFHMDTTAPDEVKSIMIDNVADNVNGEKYFESVLNWATPAGGSDVDYYMVKYRIVAGAGESENYWTIKKVYGNSLILPSVAEGVEYEFQIIAVDTAGNCSVASKVRNTQSGLVLSDEPYPDTVKDALTREKVIKVDAQGNLMTDDKGNYIYETDASTGLPLERYKYQVRWDEKGGTRKVVEQTVGRGDTGDAFVICESTSVALTLTVDELRAVFASEKDDIKIEIFKVGSNGTAKSWKKFTVKDDSRVVSDLLLEANTVYVVKVYAVGDRAVSGYRLTLDKSNIGGSGNNGTDNSYDKAVANNQSIVGLTNIPGDVQETNLANWVGYGDASDIKRLSLQTTGKYTFTLEGVSAKATLTVYEAVKTVNSKGEVKITHKKLDSVTCKASTQGGVTTDVLALEAGKDYYYEVKIGDKTIVGTEYNVKIECIDSYPNATTYDDNPLDSKTWQGQILALGTKLESDLTGKALWVGNGDAVDYYQLTADSLKGLEPDVAYQLKLSGIEGDAVTVSIGYFVNGKFKSLVSKTGAKDADSLIIHCEFDRGDLSNGQLYVQVSANGKSGNSRYDMIMTTYDNLGNSADDTAENATVELTATVPASRMVAAKVEDWVGYNDPTDYVKLNLAVDGLYQFTVSGVSNNVTVDILKKVVDAKGKVDYIKVDSFKATAGKNEVSGKLLLLDSSVGAEYYACITAPGHKSGKNSNYELVMNILAGAEDLGDDVNAAYALADSTVTVDGTNAVNYVYTAPADGGAYQFTLNNTNASGSVKVTVYELLDNGKTRKVKSITVKAGEVGSTGYLWLDDDAVKNGTGIYQVEIKGGSKKVTGDVLLSADGYRFKEYIESGDDVNNAIGTENWVGIGDSADVYEYKVDNIGVHEFTLDGINGNNIKLSIVSVDKETGKTKVLKSFTAADGSTFASFAYAFASTGTYQIVVEAAGDGKFSKYTLETSDRTGRTENEKLDNAAIDLGNPDNWSVGDTDKLVINTAAVANDVNGWVGLGDAKDFYGVLVDASGNYDLNITGIENDVKVTLYEATTRNSGGDYEIKSGKAIESVTASGANGGAVLGSVYLDASKDYYIVVQASNAKGSKNTEYNVNLSAMAATDTDNAVLTGTLGNANTADAYSFTAVDGATGITLTLNDESDKAVVTLYKVDTNSGKYTKVKSVTVTGSKTLTAGTGELCLEEGATYVVEVTAPGAEAGKTVDYTLKLDSWDFAAYANPTADDDPANVKSSLSFNAFGVATAARNAVWKDKSGKDKTLWDEDIVDYYKVDVVSGGSYTLNLDGINGNNIKVSIGTVSNGKFKSLQSVTGADSAESLLLSRELDANTTYYIKVEAKGDSAASEYSLTLTNNELRIDNNGKKVFNNNDDTWKQVAGNIDSVAYGAGDSITDWVGFGDSVDVFKIRLEDIADSYDDNGRLVFSGAGADTKDALIDKDIKLSLVDANGKSIALTFDAESGNYVSKNVLTAGVDYFLSVKNSNEKKQNIDYNIDINLA